MLVAVGPAGFGLNNWTFTHGEAPSHTSRLTENWFCQRNPGVLEKDLWPPSSPDIYPVDFSIWSILEDKPGKKTYGSLRDRKAGLKAALDDFANERVRAAVKSVTKCLRARVRAERDHIKEKFTFII